MPASGKQQLLLAWSRAKPVPRAIDRSRFRLLWWQDPGQAPGLRRWPCSAPARRSSAAHPAPHLLAFGVAGRGVGLGVVLPLEGALEGLQVVLAEGVRAQVLAGPAALGVDAQPAAVLVTWRPAGRRLSGDPSPTPGRSGGAERAAEGGKGPRAQAAGLWPAQNQSKRSRPAAADTTESLAEGPIAA